MLSAKNTKILVSMPQKLSDEVTEFAKELNQNIEQVFAQLEQDLVPTGFALKTKLTLASQSLHQTIGWLILEWWYSNDQTDWEGGIGYVGRQAMIQTRYHPLDTSGVAYRNGVHNHGYTNIPPAKMTLNVLL